MSMDYDECDVCDNPGIHPVPLQNGDTVKIVRRCDDHKPSDKRCRRCGNLTIWRGNCMYCQEHDSP